MFTKKDFKKFAEYIRILVNQGKVSEAIEAFNMIVYLNDNPNFDKERFESACGLTTEIRSIVE